MVAGRPVLRCVAPGVLACRVGGGGGGQVALEQKVCKRVNVARVRRKHHWRIFTTRRIFGLADGGDTPAEVTGSGNWAAG